MAELRELSREVGEVQRLVEQMVDARLLVVQTLEGGKGSTVEIVHESLVQGWPTLRRWLDENQDDAELVDQLRIAARAVARRSAATSACCGAATPPTRRRSSASATRVRCRTSRGTFLEEVVTYEAQQQRKRRNMVVAGFVGLGALVLAAMVALVIIQKSRSAAVQSRHDAEVAQGEAERQLHEAQRKELERQVAEAAKLKAEQAKQESEKQLGVASQKLDVAQEDLQKTNDELKIALDEAVKSEEKARSAAQNAEESARQAEKARGEAEAQRDEVKTQRDRADALYKAEHERAERLKKQIGSPIVDDLK